MVISPKRSQRPLVLGHRGASAHAADNSIEAFELALAHGADGVELDVRFTADEVVVLHHDADVGEMGPLVYHDFETIRRTHPELPTLDEALEALGDLIVNVEIKNSPMDADFDPSHKMAGVVARWVARHDIHDRVVVTSFNPGTIAAVRLADSGVVTGQLVDVGFDIARGAEAIATAGHSWIAPHISTVTTDAAGVIETAHAAGLRIIAWTVDDPADIAAIANAGIDGIISNDPRAALEVLSAL